jgi:hypothetical protein
MKNSSIKQHLIYSFIASITLGLAPFGEPHILGKIKWIKGGAIGMKGMDWFDFFMHGLPWAYLIVVLIIFLLKTIKKF